MNKISSFLIFLIVACALGAIVFLFLNKGKASENKDFISLIISIFACTGGLISAVIVVSSYLHTNYAFIQSKKPHLLIQVRNAKVNNQNENGKSIPITEIYYKNVTGNPFRNLTIHVKVTTANRTINLDDLFTANMVMAGFDERIRRFNAIDILMKRGLEINQETQKGNTAILTIDYQYTFDNKVELIKETTDYKWNSQIEQWEII